MTLSAPDFRRSTSIERVREALLDLGCKPSRNGDNFTALCPVHGDTHHSLSVTYDRHNGRTLVNCFACKAPYDEIAAALGLTGQDLFDEPLPPREDRPRRRSTPRPKPQPLPKRLTLPESQPEPARGDWKIVTTYPYATLDGEIVQEVVREEATLDGRRHKRFRQRFLNPSTGRWVSRRPDGFTPVLYNAAGIAQAIAQGEPVWIVEGEKDADNGIAAGIAATTNAQGATNFPDELLAHLEGADIRIVADRDAAGYARAAQLWAKLTPLASSVAVLLPDIDQPKADLTDHLEAGKTIGELLKLTSDDLQALAAAAEASRALEAITSCTTEARARADRGEITEAGRWADEAARRLERMPDADAAVNGSELGPLGQQALRDFADARQQARSACTEASVAAGRPIQAPAREDAAVIPLKPAEHPAPQPTPRAFSIDENDDAPNEGDDYIVRNGETVLVKRERNGDGWRNRYKRVLRGWAQIEAVYVDDNGEDSEITRSTHRLAVNFYRWVRDEHGNPIRDEHGNPVTEHARVVWDADQIRDGSWANALPWNAMAESTSRRGRETLWDAIHNACPAPAYRRTLYTSTGWRVADTGRFFVHGRGAINANGELDIDQALPGAFGNRYQLPAPTTEAQTLRDAWMQGLIALTKDIPARILAPLLGYVWQAPYKPVPLLLHLSGPRGASKTSVGRIGMQFMAPEHCFRRKELRATISAANRGSSIIGLIRALGTLDNVPVLVDDFAPDGDAAAAEQKLSELARHIYNGIRRTVGKARGGISVDKAITATLITSAEITVQGSGATRMINVPVDLDTFEDPRTTFAAHERIANREARGLLGASLISWLAEHYDDVQAREEHLLEHPDEDERTLYWTRQIDDLPLDTGVGGRMAEGAIAADHGISLMLSMLAHRGAITDAEATSFYAWARAGILEAISLQSTESSDPAHQLVRYLREALRSGSAYISTADGSQPDHPFALGWTRRSNGGFDQIVPASTNRIGIIRQTGGEHRIYLFPSSAIAAAKTAARNAQEIFAETAVSIGGAMKSHGWITPDKYGKTAAIRRIDGSIARVWDIPLDVILGAGPEDSDTPNTPTPDASPTDDGATPLVDEQWQPAPGTETAPAPTEHPAPAAHAPDPSDDPPPAGPAATPASDTASKTRKTTAKTPPVETPYRASAAVLDDGKLHFPDGSIEELPFPIRHLGDIARLVRHAKLGTRTSTWTAGNGELRERTEPGQIWITGPQAEELGIPIGNLPNRRFDLRENLTDATTDIPFVTDAVVDGWEFSGSSKGSRHLVASTRVWGNEHGETLRAMLVLIPGIRYEVEALLEDEPAAGDLAIRLEKLAQQLGYPFQVSSVTTGFNLMEELRPRDKREVFATAPKIPPHEFMIDRDIHWTRKPTEEELQHEFIHGYDRGASYLAAAKGLSFGIGRAEHVIAPEFDKRTPGYWLVEAPEPSEWLWPNPLNPVAGEWPAKQWWATTARLQFAIEQGYELEPLEAWIWPQHGRFLDTWADRVRDARANLDTADPNDRAARNIVKEIYVRSFGMMASDRFAEGGKHFHPDRFHMIQERATTNILRRIQQIGRDTGRWPVAIDKDLVLYTSAEADPTAAWPGKPEHFGRGLGQFKPEMTGRLEDVLPTLDGTRFAGKQFMTYL